MDANQTAAARWLMIANAAWVVAGLVAYFSRVNLAIATAFAVAPALRGLIDLKRGLPEGREQAWADRGFTVAAGTAGLVAMWVMIPYAASEGGVTLWATPGYAVLGLLIASLGMLGWNYAAVQCLTDDQTRRSLRYYAGFHVLAVLAAMWFVFQGDARTYEFMLRGETLDVIDLRLAPALTAVPGILWALILYRAQPN